MPNDVITSRHNALIKQARAVRDGKVTERIFIEGVRLCEEALNSAALVIEDVFCTEKVAHSERGIKLLEALRRAGRRVFFVEENVFASISDTKTPQGVIALAERPRTDLELFQQQTINALPTNDAPLIVLIHRVSNPANAGAMLRVAEAAGATGVIATDGTTDLFSAKALRGAMGSSFRVPVWTKATLADALRWCAHHEIKTVGTDVRAAHMHTDIDWRIPCAIIFGAEATGLASDESQSTDINIRIPMCAPVESLNVAVALAVVLYEAARQRMNQF